MTSLPLSRVIVLTAHDIEPPPPKRDHYLTAAVVCFAAIVIPLFI